MGDITNRLKKAEAKMKETDSKKMLVSKGVLSRVKDAQRKKPTLPTTKQLNKKMRSIMVDAGFEKIKIVDGTPVRAFRDGKQLDKIEIETWAETEMEKAGIGKDGKKVKTK